MKSRRYNMKDDHINEINHLTSSYLQIHTTLKKKKQEQDDDNHVCALWINTALSGLS